MPLENPTKVGFWIERNYGNDFVIAQGEAVFASLPERPFPFIVETVQPVARTRQGGNIFEARCRFKIEPELRWPGMSGIGKITSGEKSLLWITTHKTVDYLRVRFW